MIKDVLPYGSQETESERVQKVAVKTFLQTGVFVGVYKLWYTLSFLCLFSLRGHHKKN